ncbi:MAG: antibiotic biosynthesis monooxygenase [Actinomycetales bacterium]|nr:antibiotic biosynthesis monooxygenase [Actinomycetales bacterium]
MTAAESDHPVSVLLPGRRALLVRLSCPEGRRTALLDALNTYVDGLAEEPGTEVFVIAVDPDDESTVWLYEIFANEQAELDHRSSTGFAELMAALPALLDDPPAVLRSVPLRLSLQKAVLRETWVL